MSRPLDLKAIVAVIDQYRALTTEQIAYFLQKNLAYTRKELSILRKSNYFSVIDSFQPHIYTINKKGLTLLGKETTHRFSSVRALQHICHRNAALIDLQKRLPASKVYPLYRHVFHKLGLNPAVSVEHCVAIDNAPVLLLIDDGGMSVRRIVSAWTRQHKPHKDFDPELLIKRGEPIRSYWSEVCQKIIVYTNRDTDDVINYIKRSGSVSDFEVFKLQSCWDM